MRNHPLRMVAAAVLAAAATLSLSACGTANATGDTPRAASAPAAGADVEPWPRTLGAHPGMPGPTGSIHPDAPGATIPASRIPAAPEAVRNWRIAVIARPVDDAGASRSAETEAAIDAVEAYAAGHVADAALDRDPDTAAAVQRAAADPAIDLVVGIGPDIVGAFDLLSASALDREFLVLGTQLAEPTGNATAVIWPGAEDRAVLADDAPAFTGAKGYAARALEVGLAAIGAGRSGHVVRLS